MSTGYVLAINGSPRGENGITDLVTRKFLEGAAAAGAETETVYLHKLKMADCLGDFQCWFKTPGVCRHKDDVAAVHEKMKRANVMVYATPLYICTVGALMKRFLDRICPMAEPFQVYDEGVCRHPVREDPHRGRIVLISTAGFPGLRNFDPLVLGFERMAEVGGDKLQPPILFDASAVLMQNPSPAAEQLEFVVRAGREVTQGGITEETRAGYSRPYVDPQAYIDMINEVFRNIIAASAQAAPPESG
ncbi:MAG: flavodoxin family protein [Candidatus Geothermincolia bacterium]